MRRNTLSNYPRKQQHWHKIAQRHPKLDHMKGTIMWSYPTESMALLPQMTHNSQGLTRGEGDTEGEAEMRWDEMRGGTWYKSNDNTILPREQRQDRPAAIWSLVLSCGISNSFKSSKLIEENINAFKCVHQIHQIFLLLFQVTFCKCNVNIKWSHLRLRQMPHFLQPNLRPCRNHLQSATAGTGRDHNKPGFYSTRRFFLLFVSESERILCWSSAQGRGMWISACPPQANREAKVFN